MDAAASTSSASGRIAAVTRAWILAAACLGAAGVAAAAGAPSRSEPTQAAESAPASLPPLSETERAVHLLSRATYGVRPQDVEALLRMGREAWLERQLRPASLGPLPDADPELSEIVILGRPAALSRTAGQTERAVQVTAVQGATLRSVNHLFATKLVRALASERQLEQVMTDFWFNHFNVFAGKPFVSRALADYDETIRTHVFGRFEDLLVATARHPAMLIYLDNYLSGAPPEYVAGEPVPPAAGRRQSGGQIRGQINENYARELLELHTLGVDGGYTQHDVVELARALTGWTLSERPDTSRRDEGFAFSLRSVSMSPSGTGGAMQPPAGRTAATLGGGTTQRFGFDFRPDWHDPDPKVVLGRALPAGRGVEEALEALAMLARHPSTARHVATKLVRHFVADDAPPELVDALAGVFLATDGDLRALTRALFTSEAFYDPRHYRAKVKRPYEFVVSALRVSGAELGRTSSLFLWSRLHTMRHLPYQEAAPTGHPTGSEEWVSQGAMLGRMNFALELNEGFRDAVPDVAPGLPPLPDGMSMPSPEIGVDVRALLGGDDPFSPEPARPEPGRAPAGGDARALAARVLARVLPGVPTAHLESVIAEDLARQETGDDEALLRRALALALGSPEFQRY